VIILARLDRVDKEEVFEVPLQLPLVDSRDQLCLRDLLKELVDMAIPLHKVTDRKYFEMPQNFLPLPITPTPQPFVSSTSSCLNEQKNLLIIMVCLAKYFRFRNSQFSGNRKNIQFSVHFINSLM
jgi:hypothetical protein